MLEIKNLTILVETRCLINNLSLILNKNDKLAIIGEEGDGKSTLLKSLIGKCNYATISGSINTKNNQLGYLPQALEEEQIEKSVHDFLFIDEEYYYNKINSLYQLINELNIKEELLDSDMKNLSGGEKIKIQILKLLLEENDILLLDEPTNDLDLSTLQWLEEFIKKTTIPMIFISHDEMFLSNTANMILHIEQIRKKHEPRHTLLKSNYDDYVTMRIRSLEHQTQMAYSEKRQQRKQEEKLTQVMNKVEHQQNVITRKDPHGAKMLKRKMKTLKSQERKMQEKELTEVPDVEEQIYFKFERVTIPKTKKVLDLDIKELKIKDKVLANNIKLEVMGEDHIVIIGDNGVGKTTLLKEIYHNLKGREDIHVGYMPQNYEEILKQYKTPIDFLCKEQTKDEVTLARNYLGNMKFTSEEMMEDICLLSGGSKAKLFLLKLVLNQYQVLILDEPTRNISPLSNPIIRKQLKEFKGTIISISHDRKYIEEVSSKVYSLTKYGLEEKKKDFLD